MAWNLPDGSRSHPRPKSTPHFRREGGVKVLVACEYSGVVRDAFILRGHDAWSCDLLPSESDLGPHVQGDVLPLLKWGGWDLMIAHPPCTFLSSSGMHRTTRGLRDPQLTEDALEFCRRLMEAKIPRIAMENPVGVISTRLRKWDQMIQPYNFGSDASKGTCLWLKGLPPLRNGPFVPPRIVVRNGKEYRRWANQTDSGQNKLPPGQHRAKDRAKTYPGIANAMAEQWGRLTAEGRAA